MPGFIAGVIPNFATPSPDVGSWGWWAYADNYWTHTQPALMSTMSASIVTFDADGVHDGKSDTDYSRTLRLAASSAAQPETDLERRIQGIAVLVTADPAAPAVGATLRVLVANLRRLPVRLHLDPKGGSEPLDEATITELEELAAGIDADRPLAIGQPDEVMVHVHVGAGTTALVGGVADGHGTRLRPQGYAFPASMARPAPAWARS